MWARYLNLYGIMNSRFVKNRIKQIEKRMSICYDVCIHFIGCVWENNEPKERQKAMNRKIWKALGIAVCMLALAAPRAMAKTYEVWTSDKFAEAVQEINNKSSDTKNEIVLCDDIELTSGQMLTRGETTIKSKDENRKISIKDKNAGITVTGEGTTLNLVAEGYDKKLTIDGDTRDDSVSENPRVAFITVSGGATANMYENVTLQNGEFAGNACVVVKGLKPVTGPNSAFNMYGGVIENCSRAVVAYSWATFHMFDGEIKKCKADGDDVISVTDNSKFIMEGGTISGCKANTGGGLYANNSAIEISGGTISGCTADNGGGLYADNSTINITGGTISGCEGRWGGGLYATNQSTITINNGTISGCTAKEKGGGLYATNQSTINITGGIISECKASLGAGGGLYVDGSTITINNGTISRCTAIGDGGGLYAKNKSTINISGGTISGCEGRWGGGLYADNSTVTISGGTISGCKVGAGGGLFATNSSEITIRGGTISECSTTFDTGKGGGLYAEENSIITISGGTIKDNEAARGGGVALTNSTVTDEKPIRNWTVVGNKAYKTGGGIWLGENVKWDISDRTKQIYNNQAIEHGADICLEGGTSAIKLPIAANMYHDSSINIDNWYKDDNPRHKPSESGEVVKANKWLNGGLSLVASYTVIPVSIVIDANGGVGGSGSQTVHKGTTVTLEAPTKEGHLFKGWKDEEKGKSYPAGEDGKVNITVTEDMTLTAVWEARSFTVTYVLLNGKTRAETVNYGQTVTLGEEPRTGYTFVGWKDGENVYHAGETITVTGDMTLTAVWEARSFTVTYVLLNGKTRAETVNYGQTVTLGEEPRTGYTFVGWKDGEKMYHAGETITVTGDMTLTAEWKKLPSAENLPKTGDESPVLLWGAALAVSAVACFVLRRKK